MQGKNQKVQANTSNWKTWGVSIAFHIVVLVVIGLSFNPETHQPTPVKTIQASLVFPKIVQQKVEQIDEIENTDISVPSISEPQENTAPTDSTENQTAPKETVSNRPIAAEPIATDNKPPKTTRNWSSISSDVLNQIHSDALNNIAIEEKRAADAAEKTINVPNLPRLTEEQRFAKDVEVIINCDKTSGTVASIISGFAGGTLRCRENPDINKFIQKHLPSGKKPEKK